MPGGIGWLVFPLFVTQNVVKVNKKGIATGTTLSTLR